MTMEITKERIKKIITDFKKVLICHINLHKKCVDICRTKPVWLRGYARLHEDLYLKYISMEVHLNKDISNDYDLIIPCDNQDISYSFDELKEHLPKWNAVLDRDLARLGDLQKEFFEVTGNHYPFIKQIQECFLFNKSKNISTHLKLRKTDYNPLQVYLKDEELHAQMEAKQK